MWTRGITKGMRCHHRTEILFLKRAAVVRSSTISPLNNRTNKRNKERGVKTIELLHIAVQWKYKLLRGATLPFETAEQKLQPHAVSPRLKLINNSLSDRMIFDTQWNTRWKHAVFWYQNTSVFISKLRENKSKNLNIAVYCHQLTTILIAFTLLSLIYSYCNIHVIFKNECECFIRVSKHRETDESPRPIVPETC